MPFKKGNKLSQGGTPGNNGGRPTREEAEIKKTLVEKYWAEVEKRIDTLLSKYFREKGIARDVINRAIPYAKQVVDVDSIKPHVIDRQAILAIIATPDTHSYVEKIAAAITQRRSEGLPVTVSAPCQLPPPPPTPEEKTEHPQVTFHNFSNGNGKRRE
jgi:hypothetical protein